ncbi:MAG: TatD family hydrolase [Clostridia bacterium]|nr:TatD family hydrolase [Clostridia bacterium]
MHIFDSHAHFDDHAFDEDRHQLLQQIHAEGVDFIANIGCDAPTCKSSVALAEQYDFIYATVGWHPEFAGSWNAEAEELIRSLAVHPKVRAIGETGVDYHWMNDPEEVQLRCFDDQMRIARELKMPVVIHQREGMEDCLSVVRRYPDVQGVFHCYSGSAESAKEILKMGYYLGFTGVITFKNARKSHEVLEMMPLDRILIETDCPYMAPFPFRGQRCHSGLLPHTLETLAQIKGISVEEAAQITLDNAKRFYGIE